MCVGLLKGMWIVKGQKILYLFLMNEFGNGVIFVVLKIYWFSKSFRLDFYFSFFYVDYIY